MNARPATAFAVTARGTVIGLSALIVASALAGGAVTASARTSTAIARERAGGNHGGLSVAWLLLLAAGACLLVGALIVRRRARDDSSAGALIVARRAGDDSSGGEAVGVGGETVGAGEGAVGAGGQAVRHRVTPRRDDSPPLSGPEHAAATNVEPWERIQHPYSWDHLVLPDLERKILQCIPGELRRRQLAFAHAATRRGPVGAARVTVLIAGEAGTGKTMAAQIIGAELGSPIIQVNLFALGMKEPDEADQLLERAFDAAASCNAVVVFDEGGALWGKTGPRPRFAGQPAALIDVRALLERSARYAGIVILCSRLTREINQELDEWFDFIVVFPFPMAGARKQLWHKLLPADARLSDDDVNMLASAFALSGATINSCCRTAAANAQVEGVPVALVHVAQALEREYRTWVLSGETRRSLARLRAQNAGVAAAPTVTWPPPLLEASEQSTAEPPVGAQLAWPRPWLEAPAQNAAQLPAERQLSPEGDHSLARKKQELSELREHVRELVETSDEREHRSKARPREQGVPDGRSVGSSASNRLLLSEELAIVDLIDEWARVDRSYRKLAHRGSYTGSVFVSPTTVQRTALKHGITVPGESPRPPRRKLVFPNVPWERNRIWMWEASEFPTAGRVVYAIVDVVTRYWLGYAVSSEEFSTPVQPLYATALQEEGLHSGGGTSGGDSGPILVAWSDNGADITPAGSPIRQAQVESLFGHLRIEWPQLNLPTDPDTLDHELARIRGEYNTVRLHAAVGYVTPSDEHHGRGPQIRDARDAGLRHARAERIRYNRRREP